MGGQLHAQFQPCPAPQIQVPDGFVAETVFEVPREMGSWVALTKDALGRLIAADQGNSGLYLIELEAEHQKTVARKLPVEISGFQGLTWAFDSLYGMHNGNNGNGENGLYRIRDTNEDGLVDHAERLIPLNGSGEHGPHAVIPGPDGKSLYICSGNDTKLPEGITKSQVPRNWSEDLLLPRGWDPHGAGAGVLAPGGWIMKTDASGKQREVYSIGLRNQYDMAFNADGELFTYDSDMEWDFGTPWYRPTRVNHVISGAEFGWRSGTGKWPIYYEDSLPPILEIGPGSPVGMVFGYGTKFPARYQQALYLLDWTYGIIYTVHLSPSGSTYSAALETFATGQPMQVTDAVVGNDGALYFTVGGRGTQSTLYRIRYVGSDSTEPAILNQSHEERRAQRHQLEDHPYGSRQNLAEVFTRINSEDRFMRYAARIALESQPIDTWREQVLTDHSLTPMGRITCMIALARQGTPDDLPPLLSALSKINISLTDESTQLALLRAYQLALIRLGPVDGQWSEQLRTILDRSYPAKSYAANTELCQLLVYLNHPNVVSKTLALMRELGPEPVPDWGHFINRSNYGGTVGKMIADMPPTRAIQFALILRNQRDHWTPAEREEYFRFYIDAGKKSGGNSYSRFLSQIREDAIRTCTQSETIMLQDLISVSLVAPLPEGVPPRGPGRQWTRDDVLTTVGQRLSQRNYDRGRELYFAAACGKCHRFNGEGGTIGPDLSTVGKKFPLPDLIESIVEPSKVISNQYASHQMQTVDGKVLQGRIVEINDCYYIFSPDADAPPQVISKDNVEQIQLSPLSQMPVGLLDRLNSDEMKDLLAYLLSGGNPHAEVFH